MQTDPNHHIYLRASKWWCHYSIRGEQRRVSLRTNDVREARKARDRLLASAEDERAGREPPVLHTWDTTVGAFLTFQDAQVRAGALSQKTATRYECSIRSLSDSLSGQALVAITRATVLDFVMARREEDRSASTIRNDLTAWSRVMNFAAAKMWIEQNPLFGFDRDQFIGRDHDALNPPNDMDIADMLPDLGMWSRDMVVLVRWLRETGMRLGEALMLKAENIHPCGTRATLREGVKRQTASGSKTREIALGRAAGLLAGRPTHGRIFAGLPEDSAAVSTRFGQWRRQRQAREDRQSALDDRAATMLRVFRLHDLRHAFAIATLIDDDTLVYRLKDHLGHGSVTTTEGYVRFLKGEGSQRRYTRRRDLFGSLASEAQAAKAA